MRLHRAASVNILITGLLVVFLFYVSLYVSNLYYETGSHSSLRGLFAVPCVMYVVFALLMRKSKHKWEFLQINSVAFSFVLMLIPSVIKTWNDGFRYPVVVYIIISVSVLLAFVPVLIEMTFPNINTWIKGNYIKLLIAFVVVLVTVIFFHYQDAYFLWDIHLMFDLIDSREPYHILLFNKLCLAGHIDYSYVAVCIMFKYLFNSTLIGMRVCGVILYLLGLFGFWKCLCLFDKKRIISVRIMCLIMFGVSPYMLGMISYCYIDYALCCMFPLLAYVVLARKYMWSVVISLFYLFTKEPAIVIYSFLILGVFIVEACERRKILFDIKRYTVYLFPCVLWLMSYLFVGHWAGTGTFSLSGDYILGKTNTTYIINFNYLLLMLAVAAIIIAFAKHREDLLFVVPILSSLIAFSLMTFVFVTVNHPRYIDSVIAQINLLAAICIVNYIPSLKVRYSTIVIISSLMLVSCYCTIDPLMLLVYKQYDMGRITMITTNQYLSDGMVYNYQYQSIAAAMDKALVDVMGAKDTVIYLPAIYDNTWFTGAMGLHNPMNGQSEFITYEYWNTVEETRMTSRFDADAICVPVHYITEEYEFDPNQMNYYFYYNGAGENIASKIIANYQYEVDDFEANGIIVHRIRFWR